jgi:hypothetical protein
MKDQEEEKKHSLPIHPVFPRNHVGFAYDSFMLLHENHKYPHPEKPERLMSIKMYVSKHCSFELVPIVC